MEIDLQQTIAALSSLLVASIVYWKYTSIFIVLPELFFVYPPALLIPNREVPHLAIQLNSMTNSQTVHLYF